MSFILKALKKLEEEKAAQRVGRYDINSAILTPDRASGNTSRRRLTLAVIFLLFAAGSGGTYLLRHHVRAPLPPAKNAGMGDMSREIQASQPQAAPPISSDPGRDSERKAAEPAAEPGHNAITTFSEGKAPASKPATSSRNTGAVPVPGTHRHGQEPSGSTPSGLRVNGIALQDDPSESVAVINGVLAKRGMTIAGNRIEEIEHDRVKFSGNGETFYVQISK